MDIRSYESFLLFDNPSSSQEKEGQLTAVLEGDALVSSIVSNFLYVCGTYFQLTPTMQSPIFDWHCSALFFSSLKNWLVNPPNLTVVSQMMSSTQSYMLFLQ